MKKLLAMLLCLTLSLSLMLPLALAEEKPAYSVEGFETVDAEGNRITTGRDATSKVAMAVASKYEVSQVGAEILKKGGNAVDAAVAMGFAQAVAEPFTNGPGGGGLAVIHMADGKNIFVDFREIAPAAATLDLYLDAEGKNNGKTKEGGLASGIPGDVAGLLYMLENYGSGKLTRQEVMAPAIRIATEGLYVSTYAANSITDAYEKATTFPEMQKVYWDENGLPLEAGVVLKNPDFAKTLNLIAEKGNDGFYKGEVAQAIVDSLAKYEGVMTLEDLANYKVTVKEPVQGTYRGYTLLSSPPPSSGGTILIEILNILENFDVSALKVNSPEYIHLIVETFKLSYADRAQYMADEAFAKVPISGLTNKEYAKKRSEMIDLTKAQQPAFDDPTLFEHTDTTHYSVGAGTTLALEDAMARLERIEALQALTPIARLHQPYEIDAVCALRAGGISAGVIVMAGIGGEQFAGAHVTRTMDVIRAMNLGPGDLALSLGLPAGLPDSIARRSSQVRWRRVRFRPGRQRTRGPCVAGSHPRSRGFQSPDRPAARRATTRRLLAPRSAVRCE